MQRAEVQLSALAAEQPEARERLLDVAENFFAENGYGSGALRSITGQAGFHQAAILKLYPIEQSGEVGK